MVAANDLNDDVARLAGFVWSSINKDFKGGSPAPGRLLELANEEARARLAVKLVEALAPAAPDPLIWDHWLRGGASPKSALGTAQFDPKPAPSSRKIKGAAGHFSDARENSEKARATLKKAREDLAAAEQAVAEAEEQEVRAAAMAQGTAIWSLLRTIADTSNAIFAMRVAGPLMRAISPFPSEAEQDSATRKSKPGPEKEAAKEEYRERCERQYKGMVEALALLDGDGYFQYHLRQKVLQVITWHYEERRQDLDARGEESSSPDSPDAPAKSVDMKAWKAIAAAASEAGSRPAGRGET